MLKKTQTSLQLKIERVSFSYNGSEEILKSISFTVNSGQIICILGPNGIGKTTLLTCLARLNSPTSGKVLLNGEDMSLIEHRTIARNVGYVPQTIAPSFDYSVLEYVVTGSLPGWVSLKTKRRTLSASITGLTENWDRTY